MAFELSKSANLIFLAVLAVLAFHNPISMWRCIRQTEKLQRGTICDNTNADAVKSSPATASREDTSPPVSALILICCYRALCGWLMDCPERGRKEPREQDSCGLRK